jgi:alkylation response protein AidB-like acyl-CoA dehydrogenase
MDFSWTARQSRLHDEMRALGTEASACQPSERMRLLSERGVLGLCVDESYGGKGWDLVSTAYAYEGLGATLSDGGVLLAAGAHLFGVAMTIQTVGSPQQKERWLPSLASGACAGTIAATERGSGSNVGAVDAVVEPNDGGFRAHGDKHFVTYAEPSRLFLFVGRHGSSTRGLTTALVDRQQGGVTVHPPFDTVGLVGAQLAPVSFSNCQLPADAILGKAGAGMAVFQVAMGFERGLVLAFRLGAMQSALSDALAYAQRRRLADRPIIKHDAVLHRLARMKMRLETSRLLVYRAAWELSQGGRAQSDAALAKWHVADAAVASALDAMAIRGGAGYLHEAGLSATIDDALGATIHSGTQDVLATIVGRNLRGACRR